MTSAGGGAATSTAAGTSAGPLERCARCCAALVLVLVGAALVLDVVMLSGAAGTVPPAAEHGLRTFGPVAVPYAVAGSLLVVRRPDLPFGWLLAVAAAGASVGLIGVSTANLLARAGHTGPGSAALLATGVLAFLPIAVQGLVNACFPSGRPHGRFERALVVLLVVGTAGVLVSGLLSDDTSGVVWEDDGALRSPLTGTPLAAVGRAGVLWAPVVVLLGLVAGLGVVVRWRRAQGVERHQLAWRAWGVLASLALFVPSVLGLVDWADYLDPSVFVATLVVPVLRHRLWDVGVLVHRSTAYLVTSALLAAVFAVVAVVGAAAVSRRAAPWLAAVAVACLALPAWQASRRVVDKAFYGFRGDPARALADVARRLGDAGSASVLTALVESVVVVLRLPYAAVVRPPDGAVLAAAGTPPFDVEPHTWPLTYRGTVVGSLVACPRRGETGFAERDRRLLTQIALQAGAAVRAEALTSDLLLARQQLVTAREEDRRRLRRDLHDGLGPALTGLGLTLDAARAALGTAPDKTEALLVQARETAGLLVADVRQTVYDLRPPALDDLGLVGAVTHLTRRLAAGSGLVVEVSSQPLPELPAAVEVAAYRTAVEAVTNVLRHAGASRCRVVVETREDGRALVVDVQDDGGAATSRVTDGPAEQRWWPGVGLAAMRERAEELGGHSGGRTGLVRRTGAGPLPPLGRFGAWELAYPRLRPSSASSWPTTTRW